MLSQTLLDWRRSTGVQNLCDILVQSRDQGPDNEFCCEDGLRLTYDEALAAVQGFSSLFGPVLKGRDVAIVLGNSVSALITYLGVLWSGGRPALLNVGTPKATGQSLMANLDPILVFANTVLSYAPDTVVVSQDAIRGWIAAQATAPNECGTGDEPCMYLYTGGTTGIPKRVCYSHDMVLAAGERMQWGWPMHRGEVFLPVAPFSHIYGFLMGVCMPLQCAGGSIIPAKFKPADVLDMIEAERVTVLGGGPPAIYQAFLADPKLETRDLSSLRVCPGGGAPFPVEVHKRWEEATGLSIFEGYGMTEMAPIAVNTVSDGARSGAAGKAVPDSEISIVDLETGTQVLPNGEAGEIRIRGPHMMSGYVGNAEETGLVLRNGWIHTGDVGVLDDEGFLTITDRTKDVILHNGFNVFPREVEEALMSHDAVASVCVVGAPDQRTGERIVAYVTCNAGKDTTQEALVEHCKLALVAYRLPNQIEFRKTLPLTPAGKVDRLALRAEAKKLTAQ